jgi:hypothetical protein
MRPGIFFAGHRLFRLMAGITVNCPLLGGGFVRGFAGRQRPFRLLERAECPVVPTVHREGRFGKSKLGAVFPAIDSAVTDPVALGYEWPRQAWINFD